MIDIRLCIATELWNCNFIIARIALNWKKQKSKYCFFLHWSSCGLLQKKIHFVAHITVTDRMKLDWGNRSKKRRIDIWLYDISNSLCWTQHTCAMPDGDDYNRVDMNLIISSTLRNSSSSFCAVKIKWTTTKCICTVYQCCDKSWNDSFAKIQLCCGRRGRITSVMHIVPYYM